MKLLIKNGHVVDPVNNINEVQDVLVKDAKISKVAKGINEKANRTIDAQGKIIMPGIVDMHVHLREPGREDKETIATGTKAASKGGVTSVLAMPNTQPAIDSVEQVKLLKAIIKKTAQVNIFIAGAITAGRLGKTLTDISSFRKEGVVAITDDGSSVDDGALLLEALKEAKKEKLLVLCHCEDNALSKKGVVNLGIISTILGLRGIPKESEYKRIQRDIQLAERIDAPIHIAHVSCKESVDVIARAKKKGIKVTAETAPHYFSLDEDALLGYDTNTKVNPPLKTKTDTSAIKQAIKDGIIDCIASDHAPHTEAEKELEFDAAPFGMIGLETSLPLGITELIHKKILNWPKLVEKMSVNPAKILRLDKGRLSVGSEADLIIVDPEKEWIVKRDELVSKSKNSPFINRKLKGRVEYTICLGKVVYKDANL